MRRRATRFMGGGGRQSRLTGRVNAAQSDSLPSKKQRGQPPMTSASNHPTFPDLAGKAVLVTGGSTGIGAALVRAYAAQGCRVGLHYNASHDVALALAARLNDGGGNVFPVRGDFSVSADVIRVVEDTAS